MTAPETVAMQSESNAVSVGSLALFVPLKRKFYEAFRRGEKSVEYRIYGPRWNERTCRIGRPVVLSLGYGKARRMKGRVADFRVDNDPGSIPGWSECYGPSNKPAACISIVVIGANDKLMGGSGANKDV